LDDAAAADSQIMAYRIMPEHELLKVESVVIAPGWLDRRGVRVFCDVCGEGINYQREVVVGKRTLSRPCAGEGYCLRVGEIGVSRTSDEAPDPPRLGSGEQLTEQSASESLALPAVLHDERDLGDAGLAGRLVTRDGDELQARGAVMFDDERQPRVMVDVRQEARPVWRQPLHQAEEVLIGRVRSSVGRRAR
jgi:Prokaryotic dksA/traR C4-type zinc finger